MKTLTTTPILALGLSLALASAAFAQPVQPSSRSGDAAPVTTAADAPRHGQAQDSGKQQRRIDRLAEHLDLTEAQKLEVQALYAEQRSARQDLHQRHRSQMRELRQQHQAELATILSAEQMARYQQMREQFDKRAGAGHGKRGHDRHDRHDRGGEGKRHRRGGDDGGN